MILVITAREIMMTPTLPANRLPMPWLRAQKPELSQLVRLHDLLPAWEAMGCSISQAVGREDEGRHSDRMRAVSVDRVA